MELTELVEHISLWAKALGFQQVGITDTRLDTAEAHLQAWLRAGYQGEMHWMAQHGDKRTQPALLEPGTFRVISARMNYLPANTHPDTILQQPHKAYIARYALGRDYHKMMRRKLATLANHIRDAVADTELARAFVDSAPVMEKPLAAKAGLGWQGKHTLLINRHAGSWFFLGEIYTNLPLPIDQPASAHCGSCRACMDICPTQAIVAPYQLDARKCIAYLTIEYKGIIPEAYREAIGNRVFGCDDCQLVCPWNRFATHTEHTDFHPRHQLDHADLLTLFNWDEATFLKNTEGSAIRRTGYNGWLRNLAIALGNAPFSAEILSSLRQKKTHSPELVQVHIDWAIAQQIKKRPA